MTYMNFSFSSRFGRCLLIGMSLLLALSVYVHFISGYVGDKIWLLTAAHMWVSGKKLYVDIFEVNPPLIVWLYALPVWIALHEKWLFDYHLLVLFALGAIAVSIGLCIGVIRLNTLFKDSKDKQIALGILLLAALIFWVNPGYFGDREHLFFTITLPYVLRWLPSTEALLPLKLRILIGILAGIGFCVKPHCAVIWLGVQILVMARTRSGAILFCIENILIYGIVTLYVSAVFILYPEYVNVVLPMAVAVYSGYHINWLLSKGQFLCIACITAALTFVDFRWLPTSPYRKDIVYFLGIAAAQLVYALLNNGWGYTFYPVTITLLILTGWVMAEFIYLRNTAREKGLPDKRYTYGIRDCLVNFILNTMIMLGFYGQSLQTTCEDSAMCQMEKTYEEMAAEVHLQSFGTIAISAQPWPYLARATGATMQTRFNHIWMMPSIFTGDNNFVQKNKWVADYVAHAFADDMNHNKPELMFVDASPQFLGTLTPIDLIHYFSAWPAFRLAWNNYTYMKTVNYCRDAYTGINVPIIKLGKMGCRYDIYSRRRLP